VVLAFAFQLPVRTVPAGVAIVGIPALDRTGLGAGSEENPELGLATSSLDEAHFRIKVVLDLQIGGLNPPQVTLIAGEDIARQVVTRKFWSVGLGQIA